MQIVGLTLDEYAANRAWDADRFHERLARDNPLLVTDLDRRSLLADPATKAEIDAAIAAEGSSMNGVYVPRLALDQAGGVLTVTLAALGIDDVLIALRGRLPHGRSAFFREGDTTLVLAHGDRVDWHDHLAGELVLERRRPRRRRSPSGSDPAPASTSWPSCRTSGSSSSPR